MKKLLALGLVLCGLSFSYADTVTESSFTQTNDTQLLRDQVSTNTICHVLMGVIVSSPSTIGLLKIYNSTYTTSGLIASISLATVMNYNFGNLVVKGIYYVTTSNTNGVTIIYRQ